MYHIFFIDFSVEGHLGCFQVLAITSKAAMNIGEQVSLWYEYASFGYILKSGITGSWARLIPSFPRNSHTDFLSGYPSLHYYQQWRSVPFTLHPLQHKLSLMFLILAILTFVRWYLTGVLMSIFPMAEDFEHFLKWFLAICNFSAENIMFRSVPHFWLDYLIIWCLVS